MNHLLYHLIYWIEWRSFHHVCTIKLEWHLLGMASNHTYIHMQLDTGKTPALYYILCIKHSPCFSSPSFLYLNYWLPSLLYMWCVWSNHLGEADSNNNRRLGTELNHPPQPHCIWPNKQHWYFVGKKPRNAKIGKYFEEMTNTNLKYTSTSLFSATGGLNIQSILVRNLTLDFSLLQKKTSFCIASDSDLMTIQND